MTAAHDLSLKGEVEVMEAMEEMFRGTAEDVPLDLDGVHALAVRLLGTLSVSPEVVAQFTPNTLKYYRREGVISAPEGRTVGARYGRRHVLEAAVARLSGHYAQGTMADMRSEIPGLTTDQLAETLAIRVSHARFRDDLRGGAPAGASKDLTSRPVVLASSTVGQARTSDAPSMVMQLGEPRTITLPGGAFCVLPAGHPALTGKGVDDLARALSAALKPTPRPLPRR